MYRITCLAALVLLLAFAAGTPAADPVKHRLMFAEYGKGPNRLVELDAEGKLVWEYRFPSIAVIFQVLPEGHVLYGYGGHPTGVAEINRQKKVVWNYVSKCPQVLGCERLAEGNTWSPSRGHARPLRSIPGAKSFT